MAEEKALVVKKVKEKKVKPARFMPEVKIMNSGTRVMGTVLLRNPDVVVSEARLAAKALKDVIDNKQRKVMINGRRYLEFDDWQLLGAFYGVTAKVLGTEEIKDDKGKNIGFLAKAVAVKDGIEIAAAEAECLSYENNWKYKAFNQRFMLRSMAQTRACSKALRNCLAWIVVLAGYASTPAEEMIVDDKPNQDYKESSSYKTLIRMATRKKMLDKVEKMLEDAEEVDEEFINGIIGG
jgi:hypothetical protein